MSLSYGEASDLFQRSFPGGSADQEWKYWGSTLFRLTNLKISRENKRVIPVAIVQFPNENKGETETNVVDENGNLLYSVTIEPAKRKQFLTRIFDSIYKGYSNAPTT